MNELKVIKIIHVPITICLRKAQKKEEKRKKNGKLSKEEEKLYFARRIIAYYVFHPIEKKSETAKKGEKNLKNRNNKKNINNPPLMKGNFNIEGNKYSVIMFYLYYYYVVGAGKCFAAGFLWQM